MVPLPPRTTNPFSNITWDISRRTEVKLITPPKFGKQQHTNIIEAPTYDRSANAANIAEAVATKPQIEVAATDPLEAGNGEVPSALLDNREKGNDALDLSNVEHLALHTEGVPSATIQLAERTPCARSEAAAPLAAESDAGDAKSTLLVAQDASVAAAAPAQCNAAEEKEAPIRKEGKIKTESKILYYLGSAGFE